MLPLSIIINSDDVVTVVLRHGEAVRRVSSEAILDVNHAGQWIRGIELVGGTDFNLALAVSPFVPRRPLSGRTGGVTYDEEANAAFIHISMGPVSESGLNYSHSITPEAEFGFDQRGGLLWLRFNPQDANGSASDFVSLINSPVERITTR